MILTRSITQILPRLAILVSTVYCLGCGGNPGPQPGASELTYGQEQHMKSVEAEEKEHFEQMKASAKAQPQRIVGE